MFPWYTGRLNRRVPHPPVVSLREVKVFEEIPPEGAGFLVLAHVFLLGSDSDSKTEVVLLPQPITLVSRLAR